MELREVSVRRQANAASHADALLGSVALAWLLNDLRARIIISDVLEVVWENAAARKVLAYGGGLTLRDGSMQFDDTGAADSFAAFVRQTGDQMSTLAICFSGSPGHYLFRGWRLNQGGHILSCLEISVDHKEFTSHYSDFDRVFRLTPAEHGVVLEMMDGKSAAEIASRHGISIVTVRSHVKKIYGKIGVISREQLFSRLRPFRVL